MTRTITALGLDPGFASTGISAVERLPDGTYRSRGVKVSRTQPNRDKSFSRMRSSNDDQRRIREHWSVIQNAVQTIQPQVIGIENYSVFEPPDLQKLRQDASSLVGLFGGALRGMQPEEFAALLKDETAFLRLFRRLQDLEASSKANSSTGIGLGQAAKTIGVGSIAMAAGFAGNIPVFIFQPFELKQRFGGRKGASKEEVGLGLERQVQGLVEQMQEKVPQKTLREHAWDATGHAVLAADELHKFGVDAGLQPNT